MLIQIQYFSGLRDLGGPESVELAEGTTVEMLLERLFELSPNLAPWNKYLLVSAGTEWVQRDYVLKSGDLISLMPPVQGG
ncbi:MAG TPA: MoaD/ThiS family protein [Chthoniobacterales bacterium]